MRQIAGLFRLVGQVVTLSLSLIGARQILLMVVSP